MSAANEALADTAKLVVLTNKVERIVVAIRTINQHHNLGDAIYSVRARALEHDPGYKGESWQHPMVSAYNDAVQTVEREIGGWGDMVPTIVPSPIPCPFCGETPDIEQDNANNEASVVCTNVDCVAHPSITTSTLAESVENWNRREA